jgi:hypothetical protein
MRRRIVAIIDRPQGDAPSLDLVRTMLAQRAPAGIEARSMRWSSYFRVHHRRVGRLRVGRMFIAGDAAHVHSPFGGQGMNTGLQDVWNLVWKLDLVLRGRGNERLLDSYAAERLPVIAQVISTTHALTMAMGATSRLAQALRVAVIPLASRLAPVRHRFVQTLSQLGVAYGNSPIVEGSGRRYFDETLRGGNGIGGRFLLFLNDNAGLSATEAAKRFCDSSDRLVELRLTRRPGLMLVRPDGYVAHAGDGRRGAGVLESMRSLLRRQTGVPDGGRHDLEPPLP